MNLVTILSANTDKQEINLILGDKYSLYLNCVLHLGNYFNSTRGLYNIPFLPVSITVRNVQMHVQMKLLYIDLNLTCADK